MKYLADVCFEATKNVGEFHKKVAIFKIMCVLFKV